MNPYISTVADQRTRLPRLSWGAAFVGFVIALMTYLLLTVLGAAIGAGAFDPLANKNPFSGFGTAASIWVGVSTLLALAVGAFFAGRSAPRQGALHGLLTWALTTLATLYLVTSAAGGVVSAAAGVAGQGLSLAGQGLAAAAPTVASGVKSVLDQNGLTPQIGDLENNLKTLLQQSGKSALSPAQLASAASATTAAGASSAKDAATDPQAASADLQGFFDRLKQKAQPAMDAADRDALVNIIMARTGKSRAEAEQIADNYEQTYNQALAKMRALKQAGEQKAREAGSAASASVSHVAWTATLVLILGGAISALAGMFGLRTARRTDEAILAKQPPVGV